MDHVVRFCVGGALMMFGIIKIMLTGSDLVSASAILLAVYPLMTTIIGWDPLYQIIGGRTCLEGGRNQCGTVPYEVNAALGHNPHPDEGFEYVHSLAGSHR